MSFQDDFFGLKNNFTHQDVMTIHLHQRCHFLATKRRTTPLHDPLQNIPRNLIVLHELPNHVGRQVRIAQRAPAFQFLGCHCGEGVRDEEAAIVGEAAHDSVPEGDGFLGGAAAGGGIGGGFGHGGCDWWMYVVWCSEGSTEVGLQRQTQRCL